MEGGFDVTGGLATCFGPAGFLGQTPLPGAADGLWADYESVLDAATTLPLDGVRITLEWARLEPRPDAPDVTAFDRYRAVLTHARSRGFRVSVALIDAAWPAWLGAEAWLLPWVPERVVLHAARVADRLGDVLDGVVIVARPATLVDAGLRDGTAPPWRRRATADAASAHARLGAIIREVAVGPLGALVTDMTEVPVLSDVDAMRRLLEGAAGADEIHLRALVAGHGPTRMPAGLLARDGAGWVATAAGRALG